MDFAVMSALSYSGARHLAQELSIVRRAVGAALLAFVSLFAPVSAENADPSLLMPSESVLPTGYVLAPGSEMVMMHGSRMERTYTDSMTTITSPLYVVAAQTAPDHGGAESICEAETRTLLQDGFLVRTEYQGDIPVTVAAMQAQRVILVLQAAVGVSCLSVRSSGFSGQMDPERMKLIMQDMAQRALSLS